MESEISVQKPQTVSSTIFGWLDRIPWWVLVLGSLGLLVLLFIISPANVASRREVPDQSVRARGRITYEIVVTNSGPAEAVRVSLTETLPAGVSFVSADPKPGEAEGNVITWDLPSLKAGNYETVEVVVSSGRAGEAREIIPVTSPPEVSWRTVSLDILDFLRLGLKVTILVTLYSFILAVVLGLIAGLGRVTKPPPGLRSVFALRFITWGVVRVLAGLAVYFILSKFVDLLPDLTTGKGVALGLVLYLAPVVLHPYTLSTIYVEVFRGVPMLVQVLYLGFVIRPFAKGLLSQILGTNVEFSEFAAAVVGLGLGYGAYIAEVFRAGIQSIHRGQMEAARSLGMNYAQAMRYVILPQAFRRVLPPLANDGVALLKDSSFVSVLSVADLTRQGRLYMSRTYRAFESWNMVAVSYLVLTFLLSGVARAIERRMSRDER